MKLLSIEPSSLTILGFAQRSANQVYVPMFLRGFLDKYHFVKYPDNILGQNKFEFSHGLFDGAAIESLEVYPDGFVATSKSNTDHLDAFAEDVLTFLREWDMDLIQSNSVDRMYNSSLVFESESNILAPFEAASGLATGVQSGLAAATGLNVEFKPYGLVLSADQATISSMRPSAFKIERRAGIEFRFNQYFSSAPLRTDDHIALLEEWEKSV